MIKKINPLPWRVGNGGCIVSDLPGEHIDDPETVKFYGGYLVCESINSANSYLILKAVNNYKGA